MVELNTVTLFMWCGQCDDRTEHRYTLPNDRAPKQRRAYANCTCQQCGHNGYEVGQL